MNSNLKSEDGDSDETIAEVESVLAAIRDLGPDADPAEARKLLATLAPDRPSELTYEPLDESA